MTIESVKAILDGRKTMTRRVIKPQPPPDFTGCTCKGGVNHFYHPEGNVNHSHQWQAVKCPYGQVGDRLWVRESFFYGSGDYDSRACVIRYAVDNVEIKYKIPDNFSWDKTCKWCYTKLDGSHPIRPSIFMPRWASRLTLEITEVRVERLDRVSLNDIRAEGIPDDRATYNAPIQLDKFIKLWDSLNAKRGYPWVNNNWVWPISFKEVKSE